MIPMHDLACVVLDCAIDVQVKRTTASELVNGRKQPPIVEEHCIRATVVPAQGDNKTETTDGQFGSRGITLYTVDKLLTISASEADAADIVVFDDEEYCVETVKNWFHLGGFYEVMAERVSR